MDVGPDRQTSSGAWWLLPAFIPCLYAWITFLLSTNSRKLYLYFCFVSEAESWIIRNTKIPKTEVLFFSQMVVIYTVILAAIINMSIGNSSQVWLVLLSTCLGAILPSPKFKSKSRKKIPIFCQTP